MVRGSKLAAEGSRRRARTARTGGGARCTRETALPVEYAVPYHHTMEGTIAVSDGFRDDDILSKFRLLSIR
jgi:hypothetical protein